jgi:predicted alpha/beta-fold hydrolase
LYHSGLTGDANHVIRELIDVDRSSRIVVAGYSLGGNLALKLAGDHGDAAPPELRAVCAVSPVMDLAECVRALERRQNTVYQWNFVRGLKGRMRRKAAAFPGRFPLDRLDAIRSVREFDEVYTAPHFGYRDASDYYFRASAMRVIDRVRIPTLIITAEDDPFVPPGPFYDPRVQENPHLQVVVTRYGGHCAFVTDNGGSDDDGYWAERQILRFAIANTRATAAPSAFSQTPAQVRALHA